LVGAFDPVVAVLAAEVDFALVTMDLRAQRHLQHDDPFTVPLFLFRKQEVGRIELLRVVGDGGDFLLEPGNSFRLDARDGSIVTNAEINGAAIGVEESADGIEEALGQLTPGLLVFDVQILGHGVNQAESSEAIQ